MKNKLKYFILILINLICFIFNGIIFHDYNEYFREEKLYVNDCKYWSSNKRYNYTTIKDRWLIIKTIQDCKLSGHDNFLLESLFISNRVPGNLKSSDINISPSISGQAKIALNKIYFKNNSIEEWKRILNENN